MTMARFQATRWTMRTRGHIAVIGPTQATAMRIAPAAIHVGRTVHRARMIRHVRLTVATVSIGLKIKLDKLTREIQSAT